MKTPNMAAARPSFVVSESDAERIAALALRAESQQPQLSEKLLEELDRAEVVADHLVPPDVAGMGSKVAFVDQGRTRTVQLVFPGEADIAAGRISILTLVGAGLLGLRPGQVIDWPDRDGRERPLRVTAVDRVAP